MPQPNPTGPLRKDERNYERRLRTSVLDPLFSLLQLRLLRAETLALILAQLQTGELDIDTQGLPVEVQGILDRVSGNHKERMIRSFRSALALDIRPLLADAAIEGYMSQKITENVDLIRTIPQRAHAGLANRLQNAFREQPFDQSIVRQLLQEEYKVSGYNLRRLTRDQTSKTIAGLNEIRQHQAGVVRYRWQTSEDERVRPSHRSKNGRIFRWDDPPPDTGHPGNDIQCRCVPRPIVDNFNSPRRRQKS